MNKSIIKVVPSVELLKEMEELKIMGGFDPNPDAAVNFFGCKDNSGCYTGNCVVKCDCEEGDQ